MLEKLVGKGHFHSFPLSPSLQRLQDISLANLMQKYLSFICSGCDVKPPEAPSVNTYYKSNHVAKS